jgi:hypothetical protein
MLIPAARVELLLRGGQEGGQAVDRLWAAPGLRNATGCRKPLTSFTGDEDEAHRRECHEPHRAGQRDLVRDGLRGDDRRRGRRERGRSVRPARLSATHQPHEWNHHVLGRQPLSVGGDLFVRHELLRRGRADSPLRVRGSVDGDGTHLRTRNDHRRDDGPDVASEGFRGARSSDCFHLLRQPRVGFARRLAAAYDPRAHHPPRLLGPVLRPRSRRVPDGRRQLVLLVEHTHSLDVELLDLPLGRVGRVGATARDCAPRPLCPWSSSHRSFALRGGHPGHSGRRDERAHLAGDRHCGHVHAGQRPGGLRRSLSGGHVALANAQRAAVDRGLHPVRPCNRHRAVFWRRQR